MAQLPKYQRSESVKPMASEHLGGFQAEEKFGQQLELFAGKRQAYESKIALEINRVQSTTDIGDKLVSLQKEAQEKFSDPTQQGKFFNQLASAYGQEYIKNIPRENQAHAMAVYNHGVKTINDHFMTAVERQTKNDAIVKYYDHQKRTLNLLTETINSGDTGDIQQDIPGAAQKVYQDYVDSAKLALSGNIITKSQYDSEIKKAQKQFNEDRFFHTINTAIANNTEHAHKMLEDMSQHGVKGLSNAETETLVSKGYTILRRHEQANQIHDSALLQQSKDIVTEALQTGSINTDKLNTMSQLLNPVQFDELKTNIDHAVSVNANAMSLMDLKPDARELQMDKLKKDDFSKYLEVSRLVGKFSNEMQNDPGKWFQDHPAVLQAANAQVTAQNSINDTGVPAKAQNLVLQTPYQAIVNAQKSQGIPQDKINILSNSQALSMVFDLKNKPLKERIDILNGIAKEYGAQSTYVWNQLAKNGLPIQARMLVNLPPASQQYIPDAIKYFEAGEGELKSVLKSKGIKFLDIEQSVENEISPLLSTYQHYNGMSIDEINGIRNTANMLAMGLLADGKETSFRTAASVASNALLKNIYDTPVFNGHHFRVPAGGNVADMSKKAASTLLVKAINSDVAVPENYAIELSENQERRETLYKSERLSGGYFVTSPDTSSVQLVDSEGVPVKDKSGNPYQFSFDDLSDPTSNISNLMSEIELQIKDADKGVYKPFGVELRAGGGLQ